MARVLVVEDDRAIARGLQANLEYDGHTVTHVLRGDEAMAAVASVKPDLLILDVMLPGLSGFEICRQVRRQDTQLPIMLLTARAEDVDKVMGLDLGADDYLTKPFSLSELLARVRALLRRSHQTSEARLPLRASLGDVELDFERFIATRAGNALHLTAKEFALLRHLVGAGGVALRRDELLGRVWGEDVSVTNRTVDTHVLSLRQKLEPDPSEPRYILTVHGIGYRTASDVLTQP